MKLTYPMPQEIIRTCTARAERDPLVYPLVVALDYQRLVWTRLRRIVI